MNKIYKLVWSKTKHMYVAVCEFAKSHTKSSKGSVVRKSVTAGLLLSLLTLSNPLYASIETYNGDANPFGNLNIITGGSSSLELNQYEESPLMSGFYNSLSNLLGVENYSFEIQDAVDNNFQPVYYIFGYEGFGSDENHKYWKLSLDELENIGLAKYVPKTFVTQQGNYLDNTKDVVDNLYTLDSKIKDNADAVAALSENITPIHGVGVNGMEATDSNYNGGGAIGEKSISIGSFALAKGNNTVAIGYKATAYDKNGVSVGNDAKSYNGGVAVGSSARAVVANSVAVGEDSFASNNNEVSFGHSIGEYSYGSSSGQGGGQIEYEDNLYRKLTHVENGSDAHHVATVGQTIELVAGNNITIDEDTTPTNEIGQKRYRISAIGGSGGGESGGDVTGAVMYDDNNPESEYYHNSVSLQEGTVGQGVKIKNVANGDVTDTSKDAVNGSQLYVTEQNVNSLQGTVDNLSGSVSTMNSTVSDLSSTVNVYSTDISNLNSSVDTLEQSVSTLNSTVGALSTTIGNLSGNITSISSGLTPNSNGTYIQTANTVGQNLSALDNAITTASTTLSSSIGALSDTVTELGNKIPHYVGINSEDEDNVNYEGGGATGYNAVAIGSNARATGDNSIVISANDSGYSRTEVASSDSISIGNQNVVADGLDGYNSGNSVVGYQNKIAGGYNSVFGTYNNVMGDITEQSSDDEQPFVAESVYNNTVIGNFNSVTGGYNIIIGNGIAYTGDNAIILGNDSTGVEGAVSVGSSYNLRPIKYVADGSEETDAATVGQTIELVAGNNIQILPDATETNEYGQKRYKISVKNSGSGGSVDTSGLVEYDNNDETSADYHRSVTLVGKTSNDSVKLTNVAPGNVSANSKDVINGSQLYSTNQYIGNVETGLSLVRGDLSSLESDVGILNNSYSTLGDRVTEVENTTSDFNDRMSQIEGNITTVNNNIETVNTNMGTMTTTLNTMSSTVDTLSDAVNAMSNGLTPEADGNYIRKANTVGQNLTVLDTNLKGAKDDIVTTNNTVSGLSSTVDELGNTTASLGNQVSSLGTTVNELSSTVDTLDSNVGTLATNYTNLSNSVDILNTTVSTISAGLSPAEDGTYIRKANNVGQNLTALDTAIKNTSDDLSSQIADINEILSTIGTGGEGSVNPLVVSYDSTDKGTITMANSRGTKITNVKPALLNRTSTDVVIGSQLWATNQNISGFAHDIALNSASISTLNTGISNAINAVSAVSASKADTSLTNLDTIGRNTITSIANDAIDEYMRNNPNSNNGGLSSTNGGLLMTRSVNATASPMLFGAPNPNASATDDDIIATNNDDAVLRDTDTISPAIQDALDTKAEITDMEAGFADVQMQLDTKADKNSVYLKDEVDTKFDTKADIAFVNTELDKKADKTELETKADKAEVEKKANLDASNIDIDAWSATLGKGEISEGNQGLVNGGTVYNALQGIQGNDMVAMDNGTIHIGGKEKYDDVTAIDVSTSKGDTRFITGVATNPNDATSVANVGYVNAIGDTIIAGVNQGFSKMNDKVNKVGANAAALASLTPASFDGDEKWTLAASVGNYRDATAGAMGLFYRPSEKVLMNVRGSFGGEESLVGGGVAIALDKGTAPGVSKAQLVKEVRDLRAEREQDKARIARLEAMMAEILREKK